MLLLAMVGCADDATSPAARAAVSAPAVEPGGASTGTASTSTQVAAARDVTTTVATEREPSPGVIAEQVRFEDTTTTGPAVTWAGTVPGVVVTPPPTTAPRCRSLGGTELVFDRFPTGPSVLVGTALEGTPLACSDRLVLHLVADPDEAARHELPGYFVRYGEDPVRVGTSNGAVELRGAATLLISVATWVYDVDEAGTPTAHRGPGELPVPGLRHVREVRLVDNADGVHTWAVGLDAVRPFTVDVHRAPARLVIDLHEG